MAVIKSIVFSLFLLTCSMMASAEEVWKEFVPTKVQKVMSSTFEQKAKQALLFQSYPKTANVYVRVAKGSAWETNHYALAVKSTREAVISRFPSGQYSNVLLAPGHWDMGVFYNQKKVKNDLFDTQPINSRFDLNVKAGAVVLIDCYEHGAFPEADRDTGSVLQPYSACEESELSAVDGVKVCLKKYSAESNALSKRKLIKARQPIGSCKLVDDKDIFRQSTLAENLTPYLMNQDYIYHKATQLNTEVAFQYYIEGYPDGKYVAQTQKAIAAIEANAYQQAQKANTTTGFASFLEAYPNSMHAASVKSKIKDLKLSEQVTSLLKRYAGLPLQVQKDKIMILLTNHLKQQQYKQSLLYFEALHRLKIKLSPSFTHFWGVALVNTKQYKKGIDKLYAYIRKTGSQGQYYSEALSLSNEAEEKLRVEVEL